MCKLNKKLLYLNYSSPKLKILNCLPVFLPCNMENSKNGAPKKAAPSKLPSKQIVFSSQPVSKKGQKGGTKMLNSTKKGGVNLMRKLSGM